MARPTLQGNFTSLVSDHSWESSVATIDAPKRAAIRKMTANPLQPASSCRTALLLIDVQQGLNSSHGFYGAERSTPDFESNVSALLSAARKYNSAAPPSESVFIVHVFHKSTNPRSPLHPSSAGMNFMPCALPSAGEVVVSKSTHSAFVNTQLEKILREQDVRQLIIGGVTTDHCVSTSTRMASDLGIVDRQSDDGESSRGILALISDATACFNKGGFDAETVHAVNIASLEEEFAQVVATRDVLQTVFC